MDKKGSDEDYYLKMMAAWYFATALAKQWDATLPFIQKAIENYRVSEEHKEILRELKRN